METITASQTLWVFNPSQRPLCPIIATGDQCGLTRDAAKAISPSLHGPDRFQPRGALVDKRKGRVRLNITDDGRKDPAVT